MTDKTWKAAERRVAKYLTKITGTLFRRQPNTGDHAFDVVSDEFAIGIECKYRQKFPGWLEDAVKQADQHCIKDPKLPVVVLVGKNKHIEDVLVVMRISVFATEILEFLLTSGELECVGDSSE